MKINIKSSRSIHFLTTNRCKIKIVSLSSFRKYVVVIMRAESGSIISKRHDECKEAELQIQRQGDWLNDTYTKRETGA